MSNLQWDKAVERLEAFLEEKDPKSPKGKVRALKQYMKAQPGYEDQYLASHMLKYTLVEDRHQRYKAFLKKKAKLMGKSPLDLTSNEMRKVRRDFDRLEHNN